MSERRVESAAAERTRTDIRLLFDDYRIAQTVRKARRGRIRVGDLAERPHQLVIASMVGVTEHFALQVLLACGGREQRARDWDGHVKEWATLQVDLHAACPSLVALRGFYEARTAILHAGGHLTTGQLKSSRYSKVMGYLGAAGIEVAQHAVVVDAGTTITCVDTCLRFLDEVEALHTV